MTMMRKNYPQLVTEDVQDLVKEPLEEEVTREQGKAASSINEAEV